MSDPTERQELERALDTLRDVALGFTRPEGADDDPRREAGISVRYAAKILRDCVPVPRARLEELERIETWVGAAPIPSNKELIDRAELARLRARVEELEAMLTESQERENEGER